MKILKIKHENIKSFKSTNSSFNEFPSFFQENPEEIKNKLF